MCNLPTAPYAEQHVIAWLMDWAGAPRRHKWMTVKRDRAGNVHLHYRRGKVAAAPLVIEAHMDHPGFVVRSARRDGTIVAEFRGGVRPSHFAGARAKFWINKPRATGSVVPVLARGEWVAARVVSVTPQKKQDYMEVRLKLAKKGVPVPPVGSIGMWDLPDAAVQGGLFAARVCDDIGGVAAAICILDELIEQKVPGHVIALLTRAEEVGFAGALAVAKNGWIPKNARVIGLETSKALPTAPQGAGPVVRVGDKTGLFSPGLTHFITQAAATIADDDAAFKYQRKLMDGGTCNSTAFTAFGYDAAAMCVALGNYHNMRIKGQVGWGDGAKAGPGIASETIHVDDFAGMVRILVQVAKTIGKYQPGFGVVRDRLTKLHQEQQVKRLYATSDQR